MKLTEIEAEAKSLLLIDINKILEKNSIENKDSKELIKTIVFDCDFNQAISNFNLFIEQNKNLKI